jgi:hypothetical protein
MRAMALAFAALVALAVLPGGSALATHVGCGDLITQDTTLDSDVVCDGDPYNGQDITGLVIGADDVTLDLGGHTVQVVPGFGMGDEINGIADDGTPRKRLRIVNGTVAGFSQAIYLHTSGSVLRDLEIRTPSGVGLFGDDNVVKRNVARVGYGGLGTVGDRNRIAYNDVVSAEGVGIVGNGGNVRIAHNTVRVEPYGFFAGIAVSGFTDAVVVGNDVSSVQSFGVELENGTGASVARNFAHDSENGGIVIRPDASDIDLRRNTANVNGRVGIRVDSPSTVITRNTANDNGGTEYTAYGIQAVPGVVDGGHNRAAGNTQLTQCLNVSCR